METKVFVQGTKCINMYTIKRHIFPEGKMCPRRLKNKKQNVIANQYAEHYGMIATGNHKRFGFAARSTTGVEIS